MNGAINRREREPQPEAVIALPNLRTVRIIREVAEGAQNYIATMPGLTDQQRDEIVLAEFRGAFRALRHTLDPATADFARKGLVAVNAKGARALPSLLGTN